MCWIYHTTNKDASDEQLFFGVELELSMPDTSDSQNFLNHLPSFLTWTEDSSILTYHSIPLELRFHPGTWKWWTCNRLQIRNILTKLINMGGRSSTHLNCGLHIHFSNVLSDDHTLNFMQFVYAHQQLMLKLSRRTYAAMTQWSSFLPLDDLFSITQFDFREAVYGFSEDNHYNAVNVTFHDTIETRIFAGTLDINEFYTSLEFVKSLINFTNPDAGYQYTTDCDIDKYCAWLSKSRFGLLNRSLNKARELGSIALEVHNV